MQKKISIVIPFKNESAGINALFTRLMPIVNKLSADYEIVCINDGSTDNTLDLLLVMQKSIAQIKIIDLARGFGKEAALYAGYSYVTGDCAITIDADLQDPPELIIDMVAYWSKGYEVVRAVRASRETDSYLKRQSANLFYRLMNKISDIKLTQHAGDYILLDRKAINAFLMLKETVRFNKGLFTWIGFKEKLLYHQREARVAGVSQWNYCKLFKFAVDAITSFSKAPLEIWTYLGLFLVSSTFFYGIYYLITRHLNDFPLLPTFMFFFSGLQMIGIGILGKYIGRILIETKQRPIYIVRNVY